MSESFPPEPPVPPEAASPSTVPESASPVGTSPGAASRLAIVLVSPKTPGNMGAAARAMLNMGASDLRLVAPRGDHLDGSALAMAVHAEGVLRGAKNPDLARKFVDFMLTSLVQSDIPTQMWVYPVLPKIALNTVYRFADQPTGSQISVLQPQTISANSARWLENWTRVVQRGANPATLPLK